MHRWTTGAGQNRFLHVYNRRWKHLSDRSDAAFNPVEFALLSTVPIRFLSLHTPSFSRMHRWTTGAGQNSFLHVYNRRWKHLSDRSDAAFNPVEFASESLSTVPIRFLSLHTPSFSRMHRWTTGAGQNSFLHVYNRRWKHLSDRSNAAFNPVEFASPSTVPIRFPSLHTLRFSRKHHRATGAGQNRFLYV
jgi:hypothetical protein